MKFRWLGVAGLELVSGDERLVIDPYLTRAPWNKLFYGHVSPDAAQLRKHLRLCDHLLITHAHFDHVMDVAEVLCYSGAQCYGSSNACSLITITGAPEENVHEINRGDHLECGPFHVDVHRQGHPRTPLDRWINGELQPNIQPPLRLTDYRMDESFAFLIEVDGLRLIVGDAPIKADALFTVPLKSGRYYAELVSIVQPILIVPIHWDNLFIPLRKELNRSTALPKKRWSFMNHFLQHFMRQIESIVSTSQSSGSRVLIPEMFHTYELESELLPEVQYGHHNH